MMLTILAALAFSAGQVPPADSKSSFGTPVQISENLMMIPSAPPSASPVSGAILVQPLEEKKKPAANGDGKDNGNGNGNGKDKDKDKKPKVNISGDGNWGHEGTGNGSFLFGFHYPD